MPAASVQSRLQKVTFDTCRAWSTAQLEICWCLGPFETRIFWKALRLQAVLLVMPGMLLLCSIVCLYRIPKKLDTRRARYSEHLGPFEVFFVGGLCALTSGLAGDAGDVACLPFLFNILLLLPILFFFFFFFFVFIFLGPSVTCLVLLVLVSAPSR